MSEHFDVLIVGAGISGIAAAYHLKDQRPGTRFLILEHQESFGGTWKTHRYPGIRSDSDLYTFGYRFKPWTGPPFASGEQILSYLGEVIDENDLDRHIRYSHQVVSASWSSAENRWTIVARHTETGEEHKFTAGFLWMCQGYYRHAEGYTPRWEGMADFGGRIVHPQTWPDDLDTSDKKIVVIGSGATAATLVPALAGNCAHVTMLQRSPTYYLVRPNENELAVSLREQGVDEAEVHAQVRRRNLSEQYMFQRLCFSEPDAVKAELLEVVRASVGDHVDVEKHFSPSYRPWRQRIAIVPNGDLFVALREGQASIETDEIERFTANGIALRSGAHLDADIIVTATGFHLCALGDIAFSVDGAPVAASDTLTYRGMMFTGLPNLVWVFGYFPASWTLRAEMVADFVCRLLAHMEKTGAKSVVPALRAAEADMELQSWMDEEDFNPGYLKRGAHVLPKRGTTREWQHSQDYWHERLEFPEIDLTDEVFVYDGAR